MKIILLFLTILLLLISCKSKSNPASPAQKGINLISTIVFDNGEIKDIDLYKNYIAIAHYDDRKLSFLDISSPESPKILDTIDTDGRPRDICIFGDYLAYNGVSPGIRIYDMKNFSNPILASTISLNGQNFIYNDGYLFIPSGSDTLAIYDVAQPTNPIKVTHHSLWDCRVEAVSVNDSYAFIADELGTIRVLDINDKSVPVEISNFNLCQSVSNVLLIDSTLFAVSVYDGLYSIDVSDVYNLSVKNHFEPEIHSFTELAIYDEYLACLSQAGVLYFIDYSNADTLIQVNSFSSDKNGDEANIFISESLIFMSSESAFHILEFNPN